MAESKERWSLLPKRKAEAKPSPTPPQPAPQIRHDSAALPRAPHVEHHWLTVHVARPSPNRNVPIQGARVSVRRLHQADDAPDEPVAKGITNPDGTTAFHLPAGRYTVNARHGADARAVTVTLEHAGRATLLLNAPQRAVTLTITASQEDGAPLANATVAIHTEGTNTPVVQTATDERGIAEIEIAPGSYTVKVGTSTVRTFAETDTLLHVTARAVTAPTARPLSRYAQRARQAVSYAAPLDLHHLREDMWN